MKANGFLGKFTLVTDAFTFHGEVQSTSMRIMRFFTQVNATFQKKFIRHIEALCDRNTDIPQMLILHSNGKYYTCDAVLTLPNIDEYTEFQKNSKDPTEH